MSQHPQAGVPCKKLILAVYEFPGSVSTIISAQRETDRDSNPNLHFSRNVARWYSASPTRKRAKNYTTRVCDIVEKSLLLFPVWNDRGISNSSVLFFIIINYRHPSASVILVFLSRSFFLILSTNYSLLFVKSSFSKSVYLKSQKLSKFVAMQIYVIELYKILIPDKLSDQLSSYIYIYITVIKLVRKLRIRCNNQGTVINGNLM